MSQHSSRRGATLPLAVLLILVLLTFVALAVDIGIFAVARAQCQNAADAAALAAARAINGNPGVGYNIDVAAQKALAAAAANKVMGQAIADDPNTLSTTPGSYTYTSGNAKIEFGSYAYWYSDDTPPPAQEGFKLAFPRQRASDAWTAARVTISVPKIPLFFSRLLGWSTFDVSAQATAMHRPRDVVIITDLSGSMRFQSLPGTPMSNSTTANPSATNAARTKSLNPEAVFPRFGHYSDISGTALQATTGYPTGGGEFVDLCNISTTTASGPPIIEDFYQNLAGQAPSPATRAFVRKPDAQQTIPGGDNYLKTNHNTGAAYAATVEGIVNTFPGPDNDFDDAVSANGGRGYGKYGTFKGYTEGPGYWGKTFFIWPPDPRGSQLPATAANFANNGAKDWRQRFFIKVNTSNGNSLSWLDDNSILFTTSTGAIKAPGTITTINGHNFTYRINYAAIFAWLRNTDGNSGDNPFPPRLRAGRIRYYDAIPDPSDTNLNNRFWTTATLSDLNERLWKDYVDFVLGVKGTGAGTYTTSDGGVPLSSKIGNGDWFSWTAVKPFQVSSRPVPANTAPSYRTANPNTSYSSGYTGTIQIRNLSAAPAFTPATQYVTFSGNSTVYQVASLNTSSSPATLQLTAALAANITTSTTISFLKAPYMNYRDNPKRPRHQFWFGPMTFVDFLGNYNTGRFWWPGNVHEAQAWACKVGIQTAIQDIKDNHPNDFIALVYFSDPKYSASDDGQHNRAKVPLGQRYQQLIDSLWFPPSTITGTATEITPYDADFAEVPRAKGGTAPVMGFMIAYNQLSSSLNLRTYAQPQPLYRGDAGGLGRKGAQKLIILETDGAPNTVAAATLQGSGANAYYPIRIKDPTNLGSALNVEWPANSGSLDSQLYGVVSQICAPESSGGFSTDRKPVLIHTIAYGSLFEPANAGPMQTAALQRFQQIQYIGKTQASPSTPLPDYKLIYGDNQQRIDRMRTAFTTIMQDGVQVTLVQ